MSHTGSSEDDAPNLSEAVEHLEDVDWSEVPTMSTPEAAALTERLIEARDAARGQPPGGFDDGRA